jgi:hypothetical protein
MTRSTLRAGLGALLLAAGLVTGLAGGHAAELATLDTRKTRDAVVTLLGETGRLGSGTNRVVLQFTSPATGRPIDAGQVSLNVTMPMPGMAPMVAPTSLAPAGPGRYAGTVDFEHGGAWRATVNWKGPAGRGTATFPLSVR